MAHFRCLIRGASFIGIIDGRDGPIGFYVNRSVESADCEQARIAVLEEFRAELASRGWAEKGGSVLVDEIDEIDESDIPSINQGFVVFPEVNSDDAAPEETCLSSPFLLITDWGYRVLSEALSEPWMMTKTAMDEFRGGICYDPLGNACTIVDVTPLRDLTLQDHILPWRKIPVRLVLEPGPNLSLADVRARLVSILQGDSEIADALKIPTGEAIARLKDARSPFEVIEAARTTV